MSVSIRISLLKAIGIGLAAIGAAGAIGAAITNTQPKSSGSNESTIINTTIEYREVQETETIAFETVRQEDGSLAKGTTRTQTEGVNGVRTKTYRVSYKDGSEVSRELVAEEITQTPVNEVILVGTYEAPKTTTTCENGTYVNSAGNRVCRPSSSNTGGATAICKDGSYSYSQSRRGTCSHHGGVSRWL